MRTTVLLWVILLAAPAAAGCGDAAAERDTELVVFASASLTDAFAAVGEAFSAEHPSVRVLFNFAGAQTLAAQLVQGAPAHVFASADAQHMDAVGRAGLLAGQPRTIARNRLAIAVEAGNPLAVRSLRDLARDGVVLVLAAPGVPGGRLADDVLRRAAVPAAPASREPDVRGALAKVRLGEADAAIVFVTDAMAAAGAVDAVPIPSGDNAETEYLIGALAGATHPEAAAAFVAFAVSPTARRILAAHGFQLP